MTHEQEGNNEMNQLPKAAELESPEEMAARVGAQAVANAILNTVEISLWVRGREIRTVVDDETLHRIMALLTGGL